MADGRDDARSNQNQQFVLEQTAKGEIADFRTQRNWSEAAKPRLSAAFIRRLMLGLIPDSEIQLPGVRIRGAYVEGELDLTDCSGAGGQGLPALALEDCDLPYTIDVSGARLARLSLAHSRFRELNGEGVRVAGDVDFGHAGPIERDQDGAQASISMGTAKIDGNLLGSGAQLRAKQGSDALFLQNAQVSGSVYLRDGFRAEGSVWMNNCQVGGSLECIRGRFSNVQGYALVADAANIGGAVFLGNVSGGDFESKGKVSLIGVVVGGDIELFNAKMTAGSDKVALLLDRCQIRGALGSKANVIDGAISLNGARIRQLFDDPATSWGDPSSLNNLNLGDLSIDLISSPRSASTLIKDRVRWLKRRTANGKKRRFYDFSPQPWRQVSAALERAGDHAAARKIRREEMREANRHRSMLIQPIYWLVGEQMFGYGLSALRAGITLGLLWLAGALGAVAMNNTGALVERQAPDKPPIACASASPALYALDAMIPILDLGQEAVCEPGRADGKRYAYRLGPLKIPEIPMWRWAKALYSILGAAAVSFAILTWSGVFRPRAEP